MCVARRWGAIYVVERAHESGGTHIGLSLKGGQVDIAQLFLRNPCGVIVSACLRSTIASKVFGTSRNGSGLTEVVGLIATCHGLAQNSGEIGVFAKRFGNASPTGVATDVQHGREGPADAHRRGLDSCHTCATLHNVGVPSGGLTQGDGEDCAEAMDYVARKDQGNVEAALLHGHTLQLVDGVEVHLVEHAANHACLNLTHNIGRCPASSVNLIYLTNFLLNGHLSHQFVNLSLNLNIRPRSRVLLPYVVGTLAGRKHGCRTESRPYIFCVFHNFRVLLSNMLA